MPHNVRPVSGRQGDRAPFILLRRLTPWRSAALAGYAAVAGVASGTAPHSGQRSGEPRRS